MSPLVGTRITEGDEAEEGRGGGERGMEVEGEEAVEHAAWVAAAAASVPPPSSKFIDSALRSLASSLVQNHEPAALSAKLCELLLGEGEENGKAAAVASLAATVAEAEREATSSDSIVPSAVASVVRELAADALASSAVSAGKRRRSRTGTLRGVSLLLPPPKRGGAGAGGARKASSSSSPSPSPSPLLLRSLAVIRRVGGNGSRSLVDEIERALAAV